MRTLLAILVLAGGLVGCASTSSQTKNETCAANANSEKNTITDLTTGERKIAAADCPQESDYGKPYRSFNLKN